MENALTAPKTVTMAANPRKILVAMERRTLG
jgi:hypothetical protein